MLQNNDISTGRGRCGVARCFLSQCGDADKLKNIAVHLIEQAKKGHFDIESKLWCREKYWHA